MIHPLTVRIVVSVASLWPYIVWKREIRREDHRRAVRQRLEDAIRGTR